MPTFKMADVLYTSLIFILTFIPLYLPSPPPLLPRTPHLQQVDLGIKTKTQLIAERQVLVTLLSAVIGETS